jgi:hypothetical protein
MNFNITNAGALADNHALVLSQLKQQADKLGRKIQPAKKRITRNSGHTSHVSGNSAGKTSM